MNTKVRAALTGFFVMTALWGFVASLVAGGPYFKSFWPMTLFFGVATFGVVGVILLLVDG